MQSYDRREPEREPAFDKYQNLDGMFPEDLEQYAATLAGLAQDNTDRLLLRYARTKAEAMRERAAGRIPAALRLEATCEKVYEELPDEARW
jgi:hypothetical protein